MHMYTYTYIDTHTYMCVCIYIYIYIYIHVHACSVSDSDGPPRRASAPCTYSGVFWTGSGQKGFSQKGHKSTHVAIYLFRSARVATCCMILRRDPLTSSAGIHIMAPCTSESC